MSLKTRLKFLWDGLGLVTSAVREWEPNSCASEREFEDSLFEHLGARLPGLRVARQYGHGQSRVDIGIEDQVFIELKHNLDSRGAYQRLIGQLMDYKRWCPQLVIVLTGATDRNLRLELDSFLRREWPDPDEDVRVVDQPTPSGNS